MSPPYPTDLNIAARLADGALDAGWGDLAAFHYRGRTLSYASVREQAARFAAAIATLGAAREQRVLLALPDAPAFPSSFLGAIWRGGVAVPVNPYLPLDAYEFYLADSRAVIAVVTPWLLDTVLEAADRLPALQHVIVSADPGTPEGMEDDGWKAHLGGTARPSVHDLDRLLADAQPVEPAPTHSDEPAFWLYTSGSTGAPKGAIHLHHDIWISADCWGRRTMRMTPQHVHLSASKLFFAYGLGNSLHCPMWTGGSAVLVPEKPTPESMLAAIAEHGVTHFYGVPSFYNAILASEAFSDAIAADAFENLEVCISAGEALPAPLFERWKEATGVPVLDGLGSTELLHVFIANRAEDPRPGSSGRPIPGYDVRVVDEQGRDVGTDEVGDLWVSGDSACAGYWNRHAATKRMVKGDWFVTGDKYRVDDDGYYWYAGRADDVFKVHGKWVNPPQVESALLEHNAVREVAVVASTDGDGLACGVAYVVPIGAAGDELADALIAHAAERLSSYEVPARVEFVDELPKTPTGKIQRYRLREG